ncbi:ATP-dependent RecD-like DNA helicase [bacterium]|nr:ATP-dependent RecD-like DNA helicase [bacterium]MCB2179156.1 ATP-dependent RecD-like DNA helicase [bacterium]
MEKLSGSIERVTYYNEENGYSVLRLAPDEPQGAAEDRQGLVTVTGNLPELAPGEYLRLHGEWIENPRYGKQFKVETIEQAYPATLYGVQRYLASGLLEGIGPKLAERIVDHFGVDTLEIIDQHPERLREVPDIGPKRVKIIVEAWEEQRQIKEIMIFLHGHGVTTNLALKIYKEYQDQALTVVQENPFQLARDIFGVGFKTADRIAQSLGLPVDHPTRIEAGILFALEEMVNEGHVFTPEGVLADRAIELLGIDRPQFTAGLERLSEAELVFLDQVPASIDEPEATLPAVYLAPYYFAEVGLARRLNDLADAFPPRLSDIPPMFTAISDQLSETQAEAVRTALRSPVSVLTGGPGTGKTTSLQALIAVVESAHKRFALASPTGRAAKRLSEATGKPASTLHRLLEYSPMEGFNRDADNPLDVDLLVVDEVSMLDVLLANSLLRALKPGTHLLLVGDVDQLPSVGAGDVLREIIASERVPVTRLTEIFRQAAGSEIIINAHRINQGEMPEFNGEAEDFFRFPADTPEQAADWVEDLVVNRIPAKFGIASQDIQVLVPMYRGPAGIHAINERLQNVLNPPGALKAEKKLFGTLYRPGDKVMQVRNDYDKQVFNGDIGRIESINQVLTVDFDGNQVEYALSEADQLTLAYAISVHKAQGSEFPAVVVPLLTHHYMMLQRNLLYTGITRARKLCVLVTNPRALAIAIKNNQVAERFSALAWRLQK